MYIAASSAAPGKLSTHFGFLGNRQILGGGLLFCTRSGGLSRRGLDRRSAGPDHVFTLVICRLSDFSA
jgi:hypothetical protein